MKLYATQLSHFSRKVRVLLDLYSVPYEIIDAGNVAESNVEAFGNNPVMKVPTLVDGSDWLIESDHIANYIVDKFDSSDRYEVKLRTVLDMNIRAILNEVMAEEVKIVLGKRTKIPIEQYSFFDKALLSIEKGLEWLNQNFPAVDQGAIKYRDIHLVCLCQHLAYNKIVSLDRYEHLNACVATVANTPEIQKTSPFVLKPI